MAEYLIYFNQQWVGDHTEEWFRGRGPLARAVVDEIKAAGVYVFTGGLEEDVDAAFSADSTSGALVITDGPFIESKEFLAGLIMVEAAHLDAALAIAQELRQTMTGGAIEVRPVREWWFRGA